MLGHAWLLVLAAGVPASPVTRGRRPVRARPERVAAGLADDLDAHAAGGSFDLPHGGLDIVRVQVGQLLRGDLAELVTRDAAGRLAARGGGALVDAGCLAEQVGGGQRLQDERERATVIWAGMIWPALSAVFSL